MGSPNKFSFSLSLCPNVINLLKEKEDNDREDNNEESCEPLIGEGPREGKKQD